MIKGALCVGTGLRGAVSRATAGNGDGLINMCVNEKLWRIVSEGRGSRRVELEVVLIFNIG
jgi:hypothetical protein